MIVTAVSRTTDGQAITARGRLVGVLLTSGTDAATISVYDGTSTAGKRLCALAVNAANTSVSWEAPGEDPKGTLFQTGLYIDLSGTTPICVVYFS